MYSSSDRQRSSLEYIPAACALGECRPRHSSPSFHGWEDDLSPSDRREAEPARPGRVGRWEAWAATNARVRSSPASHRQAIARSPTVPPSGPVRTHHVGDNRFAPLRLRAFSFLSGRLCASAPLRLCVFLCALSVRSVPLWFGVRAGGRYRRQNSRESRASRVKISRRPKSMQAASTIFTTPGKWAKLS